MLHDKPPRRSADDHILHGLRPVENRENAARLCICYRRKPELARSSPRAASRHGVDGKLKHTPPIWHTEVHNKFYAVLLDNNADNNAGLLRQTWQRLDSPFSALTE